MNLDIDQSIAALASPAGGSLRGIVRISGTNAANVLDGWFEPDDGDAWACPKTARSHSGRLHLDLAQQSIDCSVRVLFWPNGRSYTGQPVIEIHLPGSPCLLETVLGEVYRHGARAARPGEFTLRAFLAGKLDLLQAEAVLGVIDAHDQAELQTALSQLAGGISGRLVELRRDLLELLADLEAGLDFVDEGIEFINRREVIDRLRSAKQFIDELLQQAADRMQARVRAKVVLAGLPNAGKSTLFNRLTHIEAALVSPERGTTRDFLTRPVIWDDLAFDLIDTAGWETNPTGIASAAQDQRRIQMDHSDLLVWCTSAILEPSERKLDESLLEQARRQNPDVIRLVTKSDLSRDPQPRELLCDSPSGTIVQLQISAITDAQLFELRQLLKSKLRSNQSGKGQLLGMTAARCRETLELIERSLQHAMQSASICETGDELIAVDLREALDHLGVILGVIYTDDILDRIFSKFCIGK